MTILSSLYPCISTQLIMNGSFNPFQFESSPVTSCEPKYFYSSSISEFWNTLSSFSIFLSGWYSAWTYWRNYQRSWQYNMMFLSVGLMGIGLSSAFFHNTLSLVGQLLDEILISFLMLGLLYTEPSQTHSHSPQKITTYLVR